MMMRVGVAAGLVVARWRTAGRRWSMLLAALALGVLMPVIAEASAMVTGDATLRRGIEDLPDGARSVAIVTARFERDQLAPELAAEATGLLARLGSTAPAAAMQFLPITDNAGGTIQLAALDGLAERIELADGRLPATCDPARCEVVRVADWAGSAVIEPALGVEVVGTVRITDRLLRSGIINVEPGATVLLTDGTSRLDRLEYLRNFRRVFSWVAPLDIERIRSVGIDSWAASATGVSDDALAATGQLSLLAPDADLLRDVFRARLSAARFRTLGGAMAVLMLAGAIVGGAALRADQRGFHAVLRRRGASPRWRAATTVAEVAGVAVVGTAAGLVAGGAAAWAMARRAGLDAAAVAWQAVARQAWWAIGFGVLVTALTVATLTVPPGRRGSAAVWRVVEALFVGIALVTFVVVGRGTVGSSLTAVRSDPVMAALPILVLLLGGLLAARVWPTAVRQVARVVPRRALAARLGLDGAAGRPLRPVASCALVAAAIGATLFATAYRATLARGALDQAAEQVPLDLRMTSGPALDRPLDLVTATSAREVGLTMFPVLRLASSLRVSSGQAVAIETVGVERTMLPEVSRWQAVVGGGDPVDLVRRLDPGPIEPGPLLPAGRRLVIDATGPRVVLDVTAIIRTSDGRVRGVPLVVDPPGGAEAPAAQRLVGDLPDLSGEPGDIQLVTLVSAQSAAQASDRQHNLGEGDLDREIPSGTMRFGAVSVDGQAVDRPWLGWDGVSVSPSGDQADFDYVLAASTAEAVGRPDGPGTSTPVPVAVDPLTARASGGVGARLQLVINQRAVQATVAAVLPRFPTVGDRFAVIDLAALERLSDVIAPGSGQPGEIWARSPIGADVAARFPSLVVTEQREVRERLQADPVARSASALLATSAAVVLLLALVVVVLVVATERHDDRAQLTSWEADGVSPRLLRRSLFWRAVAVVLPAVPFGLLSGIVLVRLTARLVAVTATATVPRPPLAPFAGLGWGMLAVALALIAGLLAAWFVAWRSLREPLPPRLMASES